MVCYTAEVMADTDGIIIGSGMAGLPSGCLLAKKELKVPMVERNQRVGGRDRLPAGRQEADRQGV